MDTTSTEKRIPIVFAGHGAPVLVDDTLWVRQLAEWAKAMPRPDSILMISAHWDERPATLGATRTVPLIYDFYGFPERYYQTKYPAPGAPALAENVRGLLDHAGLPFDDDPERGLDHGAYVPLLCMYPDADIPVLQLSLPGLNPSALFHMGRALSSLADRGTLIFGSGFVTHNLRVRGSETQAWASEFDAWTAEALDRFDVDALLDFERKAPAARLAHPTVDHYAPLLVTAGAAAERAKAGVPAQYPITGWWWGSFSKRAVEFG